VIPISVEHLGSGLSYGGEVFGNWKVNARWRISPGYSLLYTTTTLAAGSADTTLAIIAASSPRNQFQIRSLFDVTRRIEWDSSVGYVGDLPNAGAGFTPGYTRLDTRLGWHAGESIEVSLVGQNLLTPQHLEFHSIYPVNPAEIERSIFGRITWRF
jgi:iron complex outermembrane receptor protein